MSPKPILLAALACLLLVGIVNTPSASAAAFKVNDLGIYYGWPSHVNGSKGNVDKAVQAFKPFEVIVFGEGINTPTHEDNKKTKEIIRQLKPNGNKVFGYVPIGTICCANLKLTQIKKAIDQWDAMGVNGIFMDEFGFDYGVTRKKQNELVTYAHSKGLTVFANAWIPADAMGDLNEKGEAEPAKLKEGDYYLLESWISAHGKIQSADKWAAKAAKAVALQKKTGVKLAALATTPDPKAKNKGYAPFDMATKAAAMYGFSAFQWTYNHHSTENNQIAVYPKPTGYGSTFKTVVTVTGNYSVLTRDTNLGKFIIRPKEQSAVFQKSN